MAARAIGAWEKPWPTTNCDPQPERVCQPGDRRPREHGRGGHLPSAARFGRGLPQLGATASPAIPRRNRLAVEPPRSRSGSGQAMDHERWCRAGEIDDDLEADSGGRPDARLASRSGRQASPPLERIRAMLAIRPPETQSSLSWLSALKSRCKA